MLPHHYLMIVLALLAGYVIARFYPTLGNAVGLP